MKSIHPNPKLILLVIIFTSLITSCDFKTPQERQELLLSFEYLPEGGKGRLKAGHLPYEIIQSKDCKDYIEIDVYKWIQVPIDTYKGSCELKSDTLYLYYSEVIKEENKDKDHMALSLASQLKYRINKIEYSHVKLEQVP